ncbi:MAG TPA: hypothetical protein VJI12_02935 [archaeon]|nr:hypothetical protein [archaeon]
MGRNANLLITILMLATLLASSLLGMLVFIGVWVIFIIAFVIIQSRKDYFEGVTGKDHRFELKKGKSVMLKNYGLRVKFSRLSQPRTSVNEHTPRVIEITAEKNGRSKQMLFDANNLRATKIQEAFGVKFHLLDLRNDKAVLSVE